LNHYHHRSGFDAPYTQKAVDKLRGQLKISGSVLPWGTLMYANER